MDKKYQISPDLRDKLVKYFSTIEELADELTTDNIIQQMEARLSEVIKQETI